MTRQRRVLVVLLSLLTFSVGILHPQESSGINARQSNATPNERIDEVFDVLFPTEASIGAAVPMVLSARFFPSFRPESQFLLQFSSEGVVAFYRKASDVLQYEIDTRDPWDAEAIAAELPVEEFQFSRDDLSVVGQRWFENFWDAYSQFPDDVESRYGFDQLDGTKYELRFRTHLVDQVLTIKDSEALDDEVTGQADIVRWMNSVRLEFDDMVSRENSGGEQNIP